MKAEELTHKRLVEIAYKWCCKNASCGVVLKELTTMASEIPDVIGFGGGSHSVLIECKASRSDFKADMKKSFRISGRGMGKFRIYCVPAGLISIEELPEKWGLLEVDNSGIPSLKVNPFRRGDDGLHLSTFEANSDSERAVLYSTLRRLSIKGYVKSIYQKQNN